MLKNWVLDILSKIKKRHFNEEYFEIKNITHKDGLLKFQQEYLLKLILHAYENVPYYRSVFDNIGIINSGKVDLSKFNQIPILTKKIVRERFEEFISKDYTTRKWYYNLSGGSTGEPVKFIQDDVYSAWGNATSYYWYKDIIGIDQLSVKKVVLWGSERDLLRGSMGFKAKVVNWLTNTVFLNSFKMTEPDMDLYVKKINLYKPDLIRGYAGSLYQLCAYVTKKGLKVYNPKIVVSAAEILKEQMRQEIENVFGVKVYDHYGSREDNNLAGECKEGLMHMFAFHNHIEILDINNKPVAEGEEGRVIVTNLHNYSMPLIRYEIGDMAVLGSKDCRCNNPLPTLKKIIGRITDHFIKKDGTFVPAEFFIHFIGVVYNKGFIKQFQVIQEDFEKIRILSVLTPGTKDFDKLDIENSIRLTMGENCEIIWEFVDDIPKTPQGKYIYTKSLIHN